jgi:hypothetical protein
VRVLYFGTVIAAYSMKEEFSEGIDMKRLAVFLIFAVPMLARADLIIDTNATWDGSVNFGWLGSGQTLTVDATDNFFEDIGFYFDQASWGQTFDFFIFDALNGGNTLFSTSFVVGSGINVIDIGQAFAAGSTIFVQMDYNGFSGATAHFSYIDGYAGGQSLFGAVGSMDGSYVGLDHRFIANFSAAAVPEPGTLALFGIGLLGIGAARRRKKA